MPTMLHTTYSALGAVLGSSPGLTRLKAHVCASSVAQSEPGASYARRRKQVVHGSAGRQQALALPLFAGQTGTLRFQSVR